MTLSELTPHPITSVLQRNWKAEVPSWIAAAVCLAPTLFYRELHPAFFVVLAVAAFAATDYLMSRWRHRLRVKDAMTPPPAFPEPPQINVGERAARWTELIGTKARSFV